VVVVKGRQYICGGVGGEVTQLQWWYREGNTAGWCWKRSNTSVMVVKGRQYSCGGVRGEIIQV